MEAGRRTFPRGFEYTRWLVERERCQLSAPLPEPPFKEAEPVASRMEGVLSKIGVSFSADENRIQAHWLEIVGSDLARRTMPGKLTHGTLTVFVSSSTWLAELRRNGLPKLIKRVNQTCGADTVRRISLLAAPTRRN